MKRLIENENYLKCLYGMYEDQKKNDKLGSINAYSVFFKIGTHNLCAVLKNINLIKQSTNKRIYMWVGGQPDDHMIFRVREELSRINKNYTHDKEHIKSKNVAGLQKSKLMPVSNFSEYRSKIRNAYRLSMKYIKDERSIEKFVDEYINDFGDEV